MKVLGLPVKQKVKKSNIICPTWGFSLGITAGLVSILELYLATYHRPKSNTVIHLHKDQKSFLSSSATSIPENSATKSPEVNF